MWIVPPCESAIHPSSERRNDLPSPFAQPLQFSGLTRNAYTVSKGRLIRTVIVRDSTVFTFAPVPLCPFPPGSPTDEREKATHGVQISRPADIVAKIRLCVFLMQRTITAARVGSLEQIGHQSPMWA